MDKMGRRSGRRAGEERIVGEREGGGKEETKGSKRSMWEEKGEGKGQGAGGRGQKAGGGTS